VSVAAFSWAEFAAVAPLSFAVGLFCGLALSTRYALVRRNHDNRRNGREKRSTSGS
jgi:hypothetical protein